MLFLYTTRGITLNPRLICTYCCSYLIRLGYFPNFEKFSVKETTNLGTMYDYDGVMQYRNYAATKNGNPTIRAINAHRRFLGNNHGLSVIDALEINILYQCDHGKYSKEIKF